MGGVADKDKEKKNEISETNEKSDLIFYLYLEVI